MKRFLTALLVLACSMSTACDVPHEAQLAQPSIPLGNSGGVTTLGAGNNNNLSIGTTIVLLAAHASGSTLTGIQAAGDGDGSLVLIRNQSATLPLPIAHQSSASSSTARITLPFGRDVVLSPYQSLWIEWDTTDQCWVAVADHGVAGVVSTATPTRSLGTAFQPSTTRVVMGYYSARISAVATLTAGERGRVELLSDSANPPTTIRARVAGGSEAALLGLTDTVTVEAPLVYAVPAGDYVLIRSVDEVGTPTYTLTTQTEQTL